MYRWTSIEEYEKQFDEAYAKGVENEVYDDFTAAALFAMRANVAHLRGGLEEIIDAVGRIGIQDTQEEDYVSNRIEEIKYWLDFFIETSTKKLEELSLL